MMTSHRLSSIRLEAVGTSSPLQRCRWDSQFAGSSVAIVQGRVRVKMAKFGRNWFFFSPFWPHRSLCGWASRGCVHSCWGACMCAVLS